MKEDIYKCLWRCVYENDKKKISEGNTNITLDTAVLRYACDRCNGFKEDCPKYTPKNYYKVS